MDVLKRLVKVSKNHSFFLFGARSTGKSTRPLQDNPNIEVWIYKDQTGSQRGSLTINRTTNTVESVLVVPKEIDPEINLDFLTLKKFTS